MISNWTSRKSGYLRSTVILVCGVSCSPSGIPSLMRQNMIHFWFLKQNWNFTNIKTLIIYLIYIQLQKRSHKKTFPRLVEISVEDRFPILIHFRDNAGNGRGQVGVASSAERKNFSTWKVTNGFQADRNSCFTVKMPGKSYPYEQVLWYEAMPTGDFG